MWNVSENGKIQTGKNSLFRHFPPTNKFSKDQGDSAWLNGGLTTAWGARR